jgi:hypothetical protein
MMTLPVDFRSVSFFSLLLYTVHACHVFFASPIIISNQRIVVKEEKNRNEM